MLKYLVPVVSTFQREISTKCVRTSDKKKHLGTYLEMAQYYESGS